METFGHSIFHIQATATMKMMALFWICIQKAQMVVTLTATQRVLTNVAAIVEKAVAITVSTRSRAAGLAVQSHQ